MSVDAIDQAVKARAKMKSDPQYRKRIFCQFEIYQKLTNKHPEDQSMLSLYATLTKTKRDQERNGELANIDGEFRHPSVDWGNGS